MAYEARDYSGLIGMEGLSETLLKNHFTLYQGYVNNTNKLFELLSNKPKTGTDPEYAELKRRLGFEFNGMRVHEYYFENLGGRSPLNRSSRLGTQLAKDFGSYEAWEQEFKATGSIRGVGWAVLYQDIATLGLFNMWIEEHHISHPAGCIPILVMDVWEHAFVLDYGLNRAGYIEAFFKNINWEAVEARFCLSPEERTMAA
ncbi:MAG: superoxide dismutase [Bacteroidetes bacterium]|nr:superoxide dismutase [Bacteroidota bacterium]